jgi:hypothetical protein
MEKIDNFVDYQIHQYEEGFNLCCSRGFCIGLYAVHVPDVQQKGSKKRIGEKNLIYRYFFTSSAIMRSPLMMTSRSITFLSSRIFPVQE